jgi:hypothetical protein
MYNTIFRILYIIFPKMLDIAFQGLWITIFVLGSMARQPRWTTLQLTIPSSAPTLIGRIVSFYSEFRYYLSKIIYQKMQKC